MKQITQIFLEGESPTSNSSKQRFYNYYFVEDLQMAASNQATKRDLITSFTHTKLSRQ